MKFVLNIVDEFSYEVLVKYKMLRLFSRRQYFQVFFLDPKLRDKEGHKIKILRNPKTSTQNKISK